MIRAGDYKQKVEIRKKVVSIGMGGAPKKGASSYEHHAWMWASQDTLSTEEKDDKNVTSASASVEFRTWQRTDVNVEDRFVYVRSTLVNGVRTPREEIFEVKGVSHQGMETRFKTLQIRV